MEDIKTAKKKILEYMRARHFMNIATVNEKGEPDVSLVAYQVFDDLSVSFLTHSNSNKAKNLDHLKKVAFTINDLHNPMTLQVGGDVLEQNASSEKIALIRFLSEKIYIENSYLAPLLKMPAGDLNAYHVNPTWMKFSDFRSVGDPEFYELDSKDLMNSAPAKTV